MNFADLRFWLLLLPGLGMLALWQALRSRVSPRSNLVDRLLLASISFALFYAAAPSSFPIFIAELAVGFVLARRIAAAREGAARRAWLALMIALSLGTLAWFKYDRFLLVDLLGLDAAQLAAVGLTRGADAGIPPGISFYTFQMVAFAIDTARAPTTSTRLRALDYVCFTAFFPQLVAGPIERRADLLPQIEGFNARFSMRSIDAGLRFVAVGMFFKVVLADHLSVAGTGAADSAWSIWFATFCFGLRIYFDFAGYSLVAVGLARVVGLDITLNFLAPYFSRSLPELWRRWHVTLSGWFRDYVYVPLGGRGAPLRSLLVVFALSGLWHGAGLNFVVWGVFHGVALVLHRLCAARVRVPALVDRAFMIIVVWIGWLPFMQADSARLRAQAWAVLTPRAYLGHSPLAVLPAQPADALVLGAALALAAGVLALEGIGARRDVRAPYALLTARPVALLLLVLAVVLRAREQSPFIYFAF